MRQRGNQKVSLSNNENTYRAGRSVQLNLNFQKSNVEKIIGDNGIKYKINQNLLKL